MTDNVNVPRGYEYRLFGINGEVVQDWTWYGETIPEGASATIEFRPLYLAAAQPEAPKVEQEPVGIATDMAGTNGGFTKVVFEASSVPAGTKLYTHSAPASDELLEALEEARTTISMLKRNVVSEINNHDGFFRWEGVPDALQARIDAINTTLAKHKGPQS